MIIVGQKDAILQRKFDDRLDQVLDGLEQISHRVLVDDLVLLKEDKLKSQVIVTRVVAAKYVDHDFQQLAKLLLHRLGDAGILVLDELVYAVQ
jgi:hypothetical protein